MATALPTARLGRTDMEITRVGLGTWALGGDYAWGWGAQTDADSERAILRACERGVNWIDTAPVYGYGHAEEVVGRALRALPEGERPYVFTKCGEVWDPKGPRTAQPWRDLSPASIRRECDESLMRLGLERLDLLQMHWPDPRTPVEESWSTMQTLVAEGKVRAVGISNHDVPALERCRAVGRIDCIQPPFSMIERRAAADLLPWAVQHEVAAIAYSPLHSGLLAGRFDHARMRRLDATDWRRTDLDFIEPRLSSNLALAGELRGLATRLGTSVAAVAIAWALAWPGLTGAIVGARSPAQVDDWIAAATLELDAEACLVVQRSIRYTGAGAGPASPLRAADAA